LSRLATGLHCAWWGTGGQFTPDYGVL
jgi:hypothetical protein